MPSDPCQRLGIPVHILGESSFQKESVVCEISKLAPEGVPEPVSQASLGHLSAQTFVWFDETNVRCTALVWLLFLCYFSLPFPTHKTYLTDSFHQSQIREEFIHDMETVGVSAAPTLHYS